MRAEETEIWTMIGAIKETGKTLAKQLGHAISILEGAGLLRDLPSRDDSELVEAGLETWATSKHFLQTYGSDLEAYELFYAAAEHENRQTNDSAVKLMRAEASYHAAHWTSKLADLSASDRETFRGAA
jgi:hypothetical protein